MPTYDANGYRLQTKSNDNHDEHGRFAAAGSGPHADTPTHQLNAGQAREALAFNYAHNTGVTNVRRAGNTGSTLKVGAHQDHALITRVQSLTGLPRAKIIGHASADAKVIRSTWKR